MRTKRLSSLAPIYLALATAGVTSSVSAEVTFNGFASIVAGMTTDDNEPYNAYTDDLEFDRDSLFALQATADLGDGLTAVAQVLARGSDDWDPEFEWAYISYDVNDQFNIKAGRLRLPFYYYSEFLDTAYTYHWIRPPSELYDLPLTNFDGVSASYTLETGNFEHRFMGIYGSRKGFADDAFSTSDYEKIMGVNYDLTYENYSMKLVHVTGDLTVAGGTFEQPTRAFDSLPDYQKEHLLIDEQEASYTAVSFNADWDKFFAIAEYAFVDLDKDNLLIQDDSRFFVSGGYRITDTVMVHYTFAKTDADDQASLLNDLPNIDQTAPLRALVQNINDTNRDRSSHTVGVRYDFHPMAAFKAEWTAADNDGLNTEPNLIRMSVDLVF